ncbi:hypothetical protein SR870_01930 [Rhodopseudomonas palustris]|uniref:hypothetical protein n=1 Tax=Rhodopseudomonas palustris TaxID=1076 RepID=UPI002ACEA0AA|nr:hypothetical protein [Rhodopseudomonas palustris]WQH00077.1 hypothetical protein SR870_01930 [Rhodopseudomonas palustris]
MTQTWLADEVAGRERLTYEPVFCLACSQQHFICVETGRALGDRVEAVTATHSPTFPPDQINARAVGSQRETLDGFSPRPVVAQAANHAKAH